MSAPVLRPYQSGLIEEVRMELRRHRRVVLQSPTGSGKTVLTAHMIRTAASRGQSAWFLVHRKELVEQTSTALWLSEVAHGLVQAGKSPTKEPVQVASVQSLVRRLDYMDPPNLIIVDEAHHAAATTYRKVLDAFPEAYVVGLTATPTRTDGRGLDDLFDGIVLGPSVEYLMSQGYLSPYRLVAPPNAIDLSGVHRRAGDFARGELEVAVDKATIVGDAVEHYRRYVVGMANGNAPTCLVYCVSRRHAHHVCDTYRSEGIDARYVGGDTDRRERDSIVAGFREGNPPVIVSVDLFGEGLDVPGLFAVQLLRPTESLTLHLQQIGRALRPEKNKPFAMILDHVGNTWRHGLPDDDREWSLEGSRKEKGPSVETGPAIRLCDKCFVIYRSSLMACPICGAAAPASNRTGPKEVDGQLEEIDVARHRALRKREEAMARELEDLVRLAAQRGYQPSWAGIRHAARTRGDRSECIREAYRIHRGLEN